MSDNLTDLTLTCPRCAQQTPVSKATEDEHGWLRLACICLFCRVIFHGITPMSLEHLDAGTTIH